MISKKILVVIVTHNGADYIRDCLSSLTKISYPKDHFQVMVVDNASGDNTVDYVKENRTEIILSERKENIGFAAGNNIGFKYALGNGFDYVYLLNQDTVVEPDFLNKAVELAESDQKIGAVQSKLLLHKDKGKINSLGNEIHYLGFGFAGGYRLEDKGVKTKEITYASGAAVLFRVTALQEVGLFNEDFFMYHEDTDLGWRLWLGGYKIMIAPDSVVYHKYEFSRSIKKYYYMERNRYLMIFQNYKFKTILLLAPAFILMDAAMVVYSFVTGFWKEEIKAYSYLLNPINLEKLRKTRKLVQKKRKLPDREVVKRFVGKIEFQDVKNPLLVYVGNPIFNFYWQVAKKLIWW